MRHSSRMRLNNQKNWRWDDQAWSRKWIVSNNFCKKQIWIAFLRSYFTLRDRTQNTLSTYSRSNSSQYSQQANFHLKKLINLYSSQQWLVYKISSNRAKKKITASEKVYNRHVLEEKQFINKTFIFIYYRLLFQKLEHDSIFSWN
jgi:hypothetical protein